MEFMRVLVVRGFSLEKAPAPVLFIQFYCDIYTVQNVRH